MEYTLTSEDYAHFNGQIREAVLSLSEPNLFLVKPDGLEIYVDLSLKVCHSTFPSGDRDLPPTDCVCFYASILDVAGQDKEGYPVKINYENFKFLLSGEWTD